jgi:hypothetical protein
MGIGKLEGAFWMEAMRATVLDAITQTGYTRLSVAEEAGIGVRMLTTLLKGGKLPPMMAQRLDAWCYRYGHKGAWAEQAALASLLSDVPVNERLDARAEIAQWIADWFTKAGRPVPLWIEDELDDYQYLTRGRARPESEGE